MGHGKDHEWAKQFQSVRTWFSKLAAKKTGSESTEEMYSRDIHLFYKFSGMTPDDIVREWDEASEKNLKKALFDWDNKLDAFVNWMTRDRGYAKSSASNAHSSVKSLVKYNCMMKMTLGSVSKGIPKEIKGLTMDEFKDVYAIAGIRQKWILCGLKDSGMSRRDFVELTYGDLRRPFEKGEQYIHLDVIRRKEELRYETFLGPNAVDALKVYLSYRRRQGERIDNYTPLTAIWGSQQPRKMQPEELTKTVIMLGKKAGIKCSPHRLRKTFETYIALVVKHPIILKYWAGHKLKFTDVDARYIIPSEPEQRKLYMEAYKNINIEVTMDEKIRKQVKEELDKAIEAGRGITPELAAKARGLQMLRRTVSKPMKRKVVAEEELENDLNHGWRFVSVLPSGRILIEREV